MPLPDEPRRSSWRRRPCRRRDEVEAALGEHLLAELDVGALEAHDERDLQADLLDRGDDAVAMTSHFMMPPKMLTKMPFTLGSLVMILKAAVTFSVWRRRRRRGSWPAGRRSTG
jgi:hypothetical protein